MFEKEFESMLKKHGDVIDDKKKFTGLIKDYFPDKAKMINLVMMAYDLGIVKELQTVSKISNALAFRFVKQLTDDYGVSRVNADWVVSAWCVCYGRNTLGKDCDIKIQSGKEPAITEEKAVEVGKKYGDLFRYQKSKHGEGLAVCGFSGDTSHTVIFQNVSGKKPVIEVGEELFIGRDIEEIIVTEGYQYIGNGAFEENKRLHQVVMPYTLLEIGDRVFKGCGKLKRVTLTERLERIGQAAFQDTGLRTVVFPTSLYYVGAYAFAGCSELDNVKVPANMEKISEGMFKNCTNLKRITLGEGINEICIGAFKGCSALDLITIPDSVRKIGKDAFSGTHKMFIIQCAVGTTAEQYARENKIKYQLI